MFEWLRPYKYSIIIHNTEYNFTRKENWKECLTWCENTFDKRNYTCEIVLNGHDVCKVTIKLKLKEDYTQFILTWCD
jgi:hypothetical protein